MSKKHPGPTNGPVREPDQRQRRTREDSLAADERSQWQKEEIHIIERRQAELDARFLNHLGTLELADLLDAEALQKLMDDFYAVAHIPMSIIDMKGRVLVGVGWQDICTGFHRVHPETCRHCIESDTVLSAGLAPGEYRLYKCKNNLWDIVTPIIVAGQHVGNVFSGQFFFEDETVDRELFRAQARRYGFDEDQYLAALDRVPRLSRETVDRGMRFLLKLADMISQLGYSNVKLARLLAERKSAESNQLLTAEVLRSLNGVTELHSLIAQVLRVIRERTGLDAVGLRVREGDDYPYYEQNGFSDEFLREENSLCSQSEDGSVARDAEGRTLLECTCGLVLSGRTDPSMPCFTEGGSFWTSRSSDLLALPPEVDPRTHPRNRCIHDGYQSVALIPVRSGQEIIGLLQLNARQEDQFTLEKIQFFEGLAENIGLALRRRYAEEQLRELNATLESKVLQRTAELEHRTWQLQKLTLELTQAEDRERNRIAEILHEDLQQHIAGAKFQLGLIGGRARTDAFLQKTTTKIEQMLVEVMEKSRSLSHELSPTALRHGTLSEALRWLANDMAIKHGLMVQFVADGQVNPQSYAIKIFLYRAAQELLFNAAKHARSDMARLRVRRWGQCLCLTVSDRGRGFDPQRLRADKGFGLFSIRERVELLGGRMRIRSVQGRGTRLFIALADQELAAMDAGRRGAGDQELTPQTAHDLSVANADTPPKHRILLVDDHKIMREGLATLLDEQEDIEVVGQASNGREAIDQAYQLQPDVIVMDVAMPLMNGDEATRQIKQHLPQTRIVGLSMFHEPEVAERMQQAGAEAYVLKTAPAGELLAAIRGGELCSSCNCHGD